MPVGKLHKEAVEKVRAAFQSKAVDVILPMLDEDETAIMQLQILFRKARIR